LSSRSSDDRSTRSDRMAFRLHWAGSGVFLATEVRVQLHEWLAIVTGTLTPGALIVFVAILAPELLPVTLVGALVYSMFLIGQRVLNEAAYVRIDHKLNELYHASPLSPEGYFVGIAGGMLVAYLPPSLVLLGILQILHPLDADRGDDRGGRTRGGGAGPFRIRHLLGSADGPGAVRMSAEIPLRSHPQRGRVLPAWALIGWRWVWRSPAAAIVPLLQPFFFLYFLSVIAPPKYFPLQVAGAMLFSTQNIGSWCLSDSAVFRIELRLQDIFVASPHDKVRYLFGVAFSNLIPAMPALVVLGVILANVTYVSLGGWLVLIGCILTIWVLYSAIGIAVSTRLRSQREVWPVGNLLFTLLGILSPLYYPISILPPVWGEVARLLPATYAALLVQGALGLGGPANLAVDGGLLVLSTAVGLVAAWWLYEWRER